MQTLLLLVSLLPSQVQLVSLSAEPADLLLAYTNASRSLPIKESAELSTAAQSHADYLAANGYRGSGGHNFDGRTHAQRAAAAGFLGLCNEILGCGYRTPAEMVEGWCKTDSGHYKVLLGSEYDCAGFGYSVNANGQPIYVGMFGQKGLQPLQSPPQAQLQAPKAVQGPMKGVGACGIRSGACGAGRGNHGRVFGRVLFWRNRG